MDTGTLPIVRPGFLKKWTFYFCSHRLGGGEGGGQTWPKHPTPLPQQQPCKCWSGLGGEEARKRAEQGSPSAGWAAGAAGVS